MKPRSFFFRRLLLPAALISFSGSAQAVDIFKADNTTNVGSTGSWFTTTGGPTNVTAIGTTDIGVFDSTVTAALTTSNLSANSTIGGFRVVSPGGSVIVGVGAAGSGTTLTLAQTAGSYAIDMSAATADLTIGAVATGGNLRWASGNFGGLTVASGRTLTINSNFTNQGNNKTINLNGLGNIVFNGAAGGGTAMGFSITGGANVTMNGTGNWGGTSSKEIINGTLNIGNDAALGSVTLALGGTNASTPTIAASGGARTISNNITLLAVSVAGNATIAGSNDLTINGLVTNSGADRTLSITNAGVTTLGGGLALSENTSNRKLTINGGSITISGAVTNGSGGATAALLTYAGSGTMTLSNASNTFGGTLAVSSGTTNLTGGITAGSVSTSLTGVFTENSAGSISGAGTFAQGSSGTSVLAAANTFTGATTISAGVLRLDHSLAAQNSTVTNNVANGLTFGNGIISATLGGLAGTGDLALTNNVSGNVALTVGGNNASPAAYSGVISGGGSITKIGTGTLTLSGNSSAYTGGVALNNGTLSIGNSNGAGTSSSTITAVTGTTVHANSSLSGNAVAAAITLSGTNANVTLTNANASGGFSSTISGTADQTLTISQAGGQNVNLNATTKQLQNFYGTVSIASGQNLAFRATSLNNGSDNALFDVNGSLSTRNNGNVALGALSGSGTVSMGSSGGNNQSVTYTIGARGSDTTFSGAIQDGDTANGKTVNVMKTGSGIQTFSGANTYTGATTVSAGTLLVNGSLGNTAVAVNSGGTLGGSNGVIGTGTASVTVNNGGTLAPGSSPGTLTVNGSTTLNSGSNYNYQYTGGGTAADLLDVNGILTINTGAILTLQDLASYNPGDKFTLFAYETLIGTFGSYANNSVSTINGGDWLFNYNDTTAGLNGGTISGNVGSGFVTMTAIPEPNAALLVGGFGVIALLRRRRGA